MPKEDTGGFAEAHAAFRHQETSAERLALSNKPGTDSLAGWFLGPLGENEDVLKGMVAKAVEAHVRARREYGAQFGDPPYVTEARKASPAYKATLAALEDNLAQMLGWLHGSIPLSSYRNQSHMYWDITLPGAIGYFAAMLYNQNNVAAEASPVTTLLEIEVGNDLCEMLGYTVPPEGAAGIKPWGHITCDGSVANGESMWAARNLKYLPVALVLAIRTRADLAAARDIRVTLVQGGMERLLDLDTWALLNLPVDEVIGLSPRMQKECGVTAEAIEAGLDDYSVQSLGLAAFQRTLLDPHIRELPVVFAPSTAHYSWPKSAALLGLGKANLRHVHVDLDGRMRVDHLRAQLEECLRAKRPVMQVVAVMGSTEESAVDPLADIIALRDEFRARGMEFVVHVDGAWGGYFNSILRNPDRAREVEPAGVEHTPALTMNAYVTRQYQALPLADSQTVDPHKAGFIPYPAGSLCYRNGAMRDLIAFTAPVVYHGGIDPTVGVYGIEGSKPGAAAAGVYLSHSIIRPDASGYGKLLGKCIFNSKRLYAGLVTAFGEDDMLRVVPFQRMPAQKAGAGPEALAEELRLLREEIVPRENDALMAYFGENPKAAELFREMGSDQNILTYALNFRTADGWNDDVDLMNDLNNRIYTALSISTFDGGVVPPNPMFVTASEFEPEVYGQDFVDAYGARAGLAPTKGTSIKFLVSTTQDPWVTATETGNYLPYIVAALKQTALQAAQDLMKEHGLVPFRA
ncbi:MAG: pyridoxal-dependent decarboxylase [Paracoccaceae bacterium]|jgi:glutamate/tyrosine decarboxylase-like PLP-dependent enzyme|nr:pyridoxal-dependent decarboxylase [Paracoccaceae bacterium]